MALLLSVLLTLVLLVFPQRGAKETNEPPDTSTTPRTVIYVGAGVSAGLALLLILSVVIFKCEWSLHMAAPPSLQGLEESPMS